MRTITGYSIILLAALVAGVLLLNIANELNQIHQSNRDNTNRRANATSSAAKSELFENERVNMVRFSLMELYHYEYIHRVTRECQNEALDTRLKTIALIHINTIISMYNYKEDRALILENSSGLEYFYRKDILPKTTWEKYLQQYYHITGKLPEEMSYPPR